MGFGIDFRDAFTLAEVLITLGIIGVVAAMTLPSLIAKYQKQVVETRLKQSYSLLTQVLEFARNEHSDISTWDYSNVEQFTETYIIPYVKKGDSSIKNFDFSPNKLRYRLQFANGIDWYIYLKDVYEPNEQPAYVEVLFDINGDKKPNKNGYDRFYFYIVAQARAFYNDAAGNMIRNIPGGGLYYDGYGYSDSTLKNDTYRGCNKNEPTVISAHNAYCTAVIIKNGWKIPNEYPFF